MKVHMHQHASGVGVATYQTGLARELEALGHEVVRTTPRKIEYVVAGVRVGGHISLRASTYWQKPAPGAEIIHGISNWVYPRIANSLMLHDLTPLQIKGMKLARRMFERQKKRLRNTTLLTGTESTRQMIAFWLRIDPDLITVAPHGVDSDHYRPLRERRGYVLHVGDYRYYKRLEDAVAVAKANDWDLVRVGPPALDAYGRGAREAARVILGPRFHDVGYANPDALARYYGEAEALVFTSRFEGFGLPPVEAAAAGTPSVLADTPVNREIHGDLAIYANGTWDLKRLVEDMQARAGQLRANAMKYTWRRSAERHLKAWRALCV